MSRSRRGRAVGAGSPCSPPGTKGARITIFEPSSAAECGPVFAGCARILWAKSACRRQADAATSSFEGESLWVTPQQEDGNSYSYYNLIITAKTKMSKIEK